VVQLYPQALGCNYPVEVEVEDMLRPTVSRRVCPGFGHPPGAHEQMSITVRHLRCSYCEAPALTRGRICNLLVHVLLGLANAVTLRSKSCRTSDHISLSHLRLGSLSVTF
jgi:hypothetical protein